MPPNSAVDPSNIVSESVAIFDPKNPPTPENDCVGKYFNPADLACIGDPNHADIRFRNKCICFDECAVKTKQKAEGIAGAKKKAVKSAPTAAQPTAPAPQPTLPAAPTPPVTPVAAPVATTPPAATKAPVSPIVAAAPKVPTAASGAFSPDEFLKLQIPGLTPEYNEQYKAVYFKDKTDSYVVKVFPTPRKQRYAIFSTKEFAGFEKRNGKYYTGPIADVNLVIEHIKLFAS